MTEEKPARPLTEALLEEMFQKAMKDPYPRPPLRVVSKWEYGWWLERAKEWGGA